MLDKFIQIFLIGFGILLIAIVVNLFLSLLGMETWYSFINNAQKDGILYSIKTKWINFLFLIFIYPLILGFSAYYLYKALIDLF